MSNIFNAFPIYCINLKHNEDRKYYIDLQSKNKKIKFIEAVYGKKLDEDKLQKYTKNSQANYYTNDLMKPNEIGCLLSHIEVFKESLKNNDEDYIVVIEDDVDITSFINQKLDKHLFSIIKDYECIQLCIIIPDYVELPDTSKSQNSIILEDWNRESHLHHPWGYMWSTGCYIISKSARMKILESYEKGGLLKPSDYFIYEHLKTYTAFPPIVLPNLVFNTDIGDDLTHQRNSKNRIIAKYFKRRLILISVWFGKLPKYFGVWLYSLRNQKYDILLITDQDIDEYPDNVRILFMNFSDFNNHIIIKTKWKVKINHPRKLVDVKPLLGFLFYDFISHYDYWGWSDIDMMMGNLLDDLDDDYDVISYGFDSFGPMMLFKTSIVDIHKYLEHYEEILNDEYICKVDEPWWYSKTGNDHTHLAVYKDEDTIVRFYKGKNIIDFVQSKNLKTVDWERICVGINWEIKDAILTKIPLETETYQLVSNKLIKNDVELSFCHMTLFKLYKPFCDYVHKHIYFGSSYSSINFKVDYKYNDIENVNLNPFNIYETYHIFVKIQLTFKGEL